MNQYVDSMRFDKEKASGAGRHADPKTGGGYKNNLTEDKKLPAFGLKDNKPAPPYWILDSEKGDFSDLSYKTGDEVPGIVVSSITGDRGDISAKGIYKDGKWTVELGRKLDTDSQYDVQFTDLIKSYFFGVAIFFNRPVRLYSAISLDTCDLEYPVTFCIYRRTTPFSALLRRLYLNLISTSSIQ